MGLVKGVHPSHSYYNKIRVQAPIAIQQSALPTINHQLQEKYNKRRKIKRISPKTGQPLSSRDFRHTGPPNPITTVQIEALCVPYNILINEPNRTTFAPPSDMLIQTVHAKFLMNNPLCLCLFLFWCLLLPPFVAVPTSFFKLKASQRS